MRWAAAGHGSGGVIERFTTTVAETVQVAEAHMCLVVST
jgi:hypothetical protein